MPKVVIDDVRGLVQETGSGIDVKSAGLLGVVSSDITLSGGPGDVDGTFELPAGALITEIALVTTDSFTVANTNADDTVQLKVGTAAGGEQLIAAPAVEAGFVERAGVAPVGSRMSTSNGAKIETNSTVFNFVDGAPLYSANARTIHHRIVIVNAALVAAGAIRLECKYTVI